MDPILRLNEFFVEGGKQNQSHVLLHITEPSTPEEAKKGYFFALCEVNNAEAVYITKLQELIDRAENEYYELVDEPGKNTFETVLEKMNEEAFSLENATGELHCIIGVIREPDIIFSYFGKPHLLLFYRNKQSIYQRLDLIENNQAETAGEPEEAQLFSQVIQGKLTVNDFLFAGTPHIIDFFSHDRLEKIITVRPALQSAQHLERVLGEIKNGFSFGGLIINLHTPDATDEPIKKAKPIIKQESAESSLHKLFNREESTTNTLSPSFFPKLQKSSRVTNETVAPNRPAVSRPVAQITSNHVSVRPNRPTNREQNDRLLQITRNIGSVLVVVGRFIAGIFYFLYSLIYNFFRILVLLIFVILNYQKRRKTILDEWKRTWHSYRENFRNLPTLTKLMLLACIILAVGFTVSILYIRHRQALAAEEQIFVRQVALIKSKKDSIESNLIYQNQSAALGDFQSGEAALASLSCVSKEHQIICAELKESFKNLTSKLRKIIVVSPTVVADWTDFVGNAIPLHLIKVNTKIIGFSPNTSTIIVYDTLNQNSRVITTYPTIAGFTDAAAPKENDYILFVYNKNQLMQLNPSDLSMKLVDITFPTTKAEINGLVIYNRRLYTVDSVNNDMYRHDAIQTGFGQGKDWLKTKTTDLHDAVDLAIDGDLFVAKGNGQVAKFTSGMPQPFTITGLDPTITTAMQIWTYNDTLYFYLLDTANARLIILNKDGQLQAQLTNPLFKNPTGFSVDPTNRIIFLFDTGKIYKFTWPI
jgi:hypothetical protein